MVARLHHHREGVFGPVDLSEIRKAGAVPGHLDRWRPVEGAEVQGDVGVCRAGGGVAHGVRLGGFSGEFDFDLHAMKRIDYIGVTFRTRSVEEVREINRLMRVDLWDAVESGKLALPIDKSYPLEQAAEALAHMRANEHFGKIVLTQ